MTSSIKHLEIELSKIRAGRSNPSMLDGIMVDYYGNKTPINQVGNIATPDPRTITVQPWEKDIINDEEYQKFKEEETNTKKMSTILKSLNVPFRKTTKRESFRQMGSQ